MPATPDPAALHRRLAEFAAFGATPEGGIDRPEATEANGQARDHFRAWLEAAGFAVRVDAVGNMFGLLELAGPEAPWLLTGSHLDSQPKGGRLDGTYGVLASTVAAESVRSALLREGAAPRANLAVVSWTNEEGARFQPSVLGSSTYAGIHAPGWALERRDGRGISVGEALAAIGYRGNDPPAPKPFAYVELHVECGPLLEQAGRTLGVIDRWWGARKLELVYQGEPSHTGPTPMARRRDALYAAAALMAGLRAMADAAPDDSLRTSVGRLEVEPNSPNVVPARVTLFIELRSPFPDVLERAGAELMELAQASAERARVGWIVRRDELRRPGRFDAGLQRLAATVAAGLGHPAMSLDTIAAHDAVPLATICPSLVVVTPSKGGLCHTPLEDTDPADLERGLQLLTGMLDRLVRQGPEALS